ncbi:MAG: hypothetical protein ACRDY3_13025 [Acidimicrobiales bacterium]
MTTSSDPAVGTTLTATSSCPTGERLAGGGGRVTVADATGSSGGTSTGGSVADATRGNVVLQSSYPVSGGWRTVAVVTGQLAAGRSMALNPYVLCGKG